MKCTSMEGNHGTVANWYDKGCEPICTTLLLSMRVTRLYGRDTYGQMQAIVAPPNVLRPA